MLRRAFLSGAVATITIVGRTPDNGAHLAQAARNQVGVTTGYDPHYIRIPYPGGDVPRSTGVCADVVVRAGRDGLGLDLQRLVHEDMLGDFAAYPHTWGMTHPDSNIDHRRVLNLEAFWRRTGCELWHSSGVRTAGATAGNAFPLPLRLATSLPGGSMRGCLTSA